MVRFYVPLSQRLLRPKLNPKIDFASRNVLLFPMGNSNGQANDMVSVYLNYGENQNSAEGWHVCAQFALAISNPNDPTVYIQSRAFLFNSHSLPRNHDNTD